MGRHVASGRDLRYLLLGMVRHIILDAERERDKEQEHDQEWVVTPTWHQSITSDGNVCITSKQTEHPTMKPVV